MTAAVESADLSPCARADSVIDIVRAQAARTDEEAAFPVEALAALREIGLLGLLVPKEHGGLGGTVRDMLDISTRLAREDLSVAMIFAMHCQQVAAIVLRGNAELRAGLLPRVAAGEVYIASVTTERGKGGHLLSAAAGLTAADEGMLTIDRDAPIVTGGAYADGFLITMRAPEATSPTEVSLVYADRDQLEISYTGDWQPLGMRASHSVPMRLSGRVPGHQVVGRHGGFREIVTSVFGPLAHLGWSACWLGAATGALSRTVRHLRSPEGRKQYDLSSELLLTRLARVRSRLDTVHALLLHTLDAVEQRTEDITAPPVQLLINALKIQAAELDFAAVNELMELAGLRHGYMRTSPLWLERVFRDLRAASMNFSNDRLYLVDGQLALLDTEVRLA